MRTSTTDSPPRRLRAILAVLVSAVAGVGALFGTFTAPAAASVNVALTSMVASPDTVPNRGTTKVTLTAVSNGTAAASNVTLRLEVGEEVDVTLVGQPQCSAGGIVSSLEDAYGCAFTSVTPGQTITAAIDVSLFTSEPQPVPLWGWVQSTNEDVPNGGADNDRSVEVNITAGSGGGRGGDEGKPGGDGGGGGGQTEAAPVITKFTLSPKVFRAAKKGAMMTKVATGTTVTFGLDKAATATFKVQKAVTGRLVGKVCRTLTKANRKKAKCTRWVAVAGSATKTAKAGTNRCKFTGRVNGRALKPGSYRLTITAKTAGSAASKVRTASFKVVR